MSTPKIDAVVIGRNEGKRLLACLASLKGQVRHLIYVDSGSDDGSVAAAREMGATVVELDISQPFTAARARNAGLAMLSDDCSLVQLVDGDCIVDPDWFSRAISFLQANPNVAVVCGRRRERFPDASVYNRLCDQEWDTPLGEAKACGGDALMYLAPLRQAGGYREDLIAGEEPELCLRLRMAGWQIWRLDAEMTLHDAQMLHFAQWWTRTRRAGYAFAEGATLHGAPPERHWVAETRRALLWGMGLPFAIALSSLVTSWALVALLIYPAQLLRLSRRLGWETAIFSLLGKTPEALGALDYHWHRILGRKRGLIEYKS
ncbi:glycosyltransferase [Parasedimentitalea maritima]|uniref:Glycosyltransferase n=1 Tax=Parasedimentitalea maritima TaxID=2578117 RepID=A0ABY2UZE3_9RHOB|nr:glycosyltransferase [Zongyanglinia marina]TLP67326.1 glycosyltransferase [Zongyanglinia marina]